MRLLLFLLLPTLTFAQLKGRQWTGYDSQRAKQRIVISDDYLIKYYYGYTDVPENSKWMASDSVPIHSMDNGVIVIKNKRGGEGFAAGLYTFRENGDVLKLTQLYDRYDTPEAAKKGAESYKYANLIANEYYSLMAFSKLENMKSLDELTKRDFMLVMNRLQAYEKDMEGFLEVSPPYMRRNVFRVTEGIINRTFVELGYNPYKMTEKWFFENFRDDPEVQAIMEGQVHLRLE